MLTIADSSLTPAEKEEREVERLIDREPPPSRKYRPRRGPKWDSRRQRMKVEDPDLSPPVEGDRDLSLNRKVQGAFHRMAERVAKKGPLEKIEKQNQKLYVRLKELIGKFDAALREASSAVADDFSEYAQKKYVDPTEEGWSNELTLKRDIEEVSQLIDQLSKRKKTLSQAFRRADRNTIVKTVVEAWPSGKRGWPDRAAIIAGLDQAIDKVPIPEAFKVPFLRGEVSDALQDRKLIRKLIDSTSKRLPLTGIEDQAVVGFAQLASAYRILIDNPDSVDEGSLSRGMDELSETLKAQSQELLELGSIMEAWHGAMSGFKAQEASSFDPGSKEDLGRVLKDLDGFFGKKGEKGRTMDPGPVMQGISEYVSENYESVPEELQALLDEYEIDVEWGKPEDPEAEARAKADEAEAEEIRKRMGPFPHRACGAASNKAPSIEDMAHRTATYHGIDDRRGNPTNPANTGYRSYDRRHFTEVHFKSILKAAGDMLEGDDWLKYGWEGGSEDAPVRAALDMAISLADGNLYQSKIDAETYNMLLNRLAKWGHDSFSDTVLPGKAEAGDKRSATAMSKSKSYMNIVRAASDLRNADPQAALTILKNLRAMVSTAATSQDISEHVAADPREVEGAGVGFEGSPELVELGGMSEEDFDKLKDDVKKRVDRLFTEEDVDKFMSGWDELLEDVGKKTAAWLGNSVPIPVLIKLAASSEEAKRVLGPVLVAAKKKKDKKKGKKKGKKAPPPFIEGKKEEGGEAFGGKKAPPFGEERKAVEIVGADLDW